ncbi:hypothetical protein J2Z21_007466 [Streptomyces griseochromogenes]|uniref:Uncharacterized protein n=1 Tax=Streptomyces griseochromogenes TaxID=68214 RepID=A0ABS4M457_9ACTN|nr:hypothetical protein [Streptomyces griseochromogenes]
MALEPTGLRRRDTLSRDVWAVIQAVTTARPSKSSGLRSIWTRSGRSEPSPGRQRRLENLRCLRVTRFRRRHGPMMMLRSDDRGWNVQCIESSGGTIGSARGERRPPPCVRRPRRGRCRLQGSRPSLARRCASGDPPWSRSSCCGGRQALRDKDGSLAAAEEPALAAVPASAPGRAWSRSGGLVRPVGASCFVPAEEGLPDPFLKRTDVWPAGVHGRLGAGDARGTPQVTSPPLAAAEPAESVEPLVAVVRSCYWQPLTGDLGDPRDHPVL